VPDSLLFIRVARQQGYSVAAAEAALAAVRERLQEAGATGRRLYIFRTGDGGVGGGDGSPGETPSRPRLLLAFQSADAALAFAQRAGLGSSPRLISLTLSQTLAALIQRPAIGALLVAHECEAPTLAQTLPPGTRIERSALIALLAGVTP
jgi:hypothetical protein